MRHLADDSERLLIVVSNRTGLTKRYGDAGFRAVDNALLRLRAAWGPERVLILYSDDQRSSPVEALPGANPYNPSSIRAMVDDAERKRWQSYASTVMILGGHRIVPFFRIPNPSDDPDGVVLSDAPYACAGDDYYRPLRVVSRIPDCGDQNPSLILTQLERLSSDLDTGAPGPASASGYTASAWREASQKVFSPLFSSLYLRMSPPWNIAHYHNQRTQLARIRYFNLHGHNDGQVWHGQSDPLFSASYEDFPISLRSMDISGREAFRAVVLTEACYGATFTRSSIASRFLRLGADVFIGSTAMSYGAIFPPLSGADLIAQYFLRYFRAGFYSGTAFRLAKLAFVAQMMEQQGFLDAEDQKTLLSFVFTGNPYAQVFPETPEQAISSGEIRKIYQKSSNVHCIQAMAVPEVSQMPATLLKELQYLTTASSSNSVELNGQGTCNDSVWYGHRGIITKDVEVFSLHSPLLDGSTAIAKVTVKSGEIAKTLISR